MARELGLPGRGSLEDLRLTIEGKVREEGVFLEVKITSQFKGPELQLLVQELTLAKAYELREALDQANQKISDQDAEIETLTAAALREHTASRHSSVDDFADLRRQLKQEKENGKQLWRLNCRQLAEQEELLAAKELELLQPVV